MEKNHGMILTPYFYTALFLGSGCATEHEGIFSPDGTGACNTTECYEACQLSGYEIGGFCVDGTCICEGEVADAGVDTAEDTAGDNIPRPDSEHPGTCDIDILFVIDTSGSMMDAAENLAHAAFPNFANELETYPQLGKYRVAVTTHLYGENEVTEGTFIQDSLFLTKGWPAGQEHDSFWCEELPTVDCNFASGETWMTGPSPTLHNEFACVGRVACHQNLYVDEPTLQAGLEALRFPVNSGFLREHALLLVVFITDERDRSPLPLSRIYDNILALKGGDEKYVVALTLAGPRVGTVEINYITRAMGCISDYYGAIEETPHIIEFSEMFGTRGLHYNLCEDDISSALTSAIDALEMSCEEILI